jgi:acyl dehydratase
MATLTFEDFPPGRFGSFGPRHVTREEILSFAAEFDPQPMHLDEEAAKQSLLKGLAASG